MQQTAEELGADVMTRSDGYRRLRMGMGMEMAPTSFGFPPVRGRPSATVNCLTS